MLSKGMKSFCVSCIASFLFAGCASHRMERDFFDRDLGTRLERLKNYSLQDQYRIFRYGNDVVHPPLLDLALPIADRGAEAIPFLMQRLRTENETSSVRDILVILEDMAFKKTYDVRSDDALMSLVELKISQIKDKGWQTTCQKMLRTVREG